MPQQTTNRNFTINIPSVELNAGEKLIFKFGVTNILPDSNFTASINEGSLKVSSLAALNDGTFIESRISKEFKSGSFLHLTLETSLTNPLRSALADQTYTRFLLLSRRPDETNVITTFTKREGKTSYGFLIPENISDNVLLNINTITKEVKQKLINDQSVISDISGGGF